MALKSFGIVATMSKLGIPILVSAKSRSVGIRVDFFHDILTQVGDDQDVVQGVSTFTARLSEYARILDKTQTVDASSEKTLILLDEFGTGTDQATGGALAQAILENLLSRKTTRTVATTHSPRLKTLSLLDERIDVATVYFDDNQIYSLRYGMIGDSYGLRAAQRCMPKLPTSVLDRAEAIVKEETNLDDQIDALKQSAVREKEIAKGELKEAFTLKEKILFSWNALEKISKLYENKFNRMDLRLESMLQSIQDQSSDSMYTILGATLAEIRLIKKSVESLANSLHGKGFTFNVINGNIENV